VRLAVVICILVCCALSFARELAAQDIAQPAHSVPEQAPSPEQVPSPHGPTLPPTPARLAATNDRFWLSAQANFITQAHPSFTAPYSGINSLSPQADAATSRVVTLYAGVQLTHSLDVLFNVEEAGGGGIGDALGIAGFTNLDVVRNPTLSQAPYVARLILHGTVPLSTAMVEVERGPLQMTAAVPVRRIDVWFGKMSTVDWFDVNAIGSDSHLQFMNWAIDNNGAYDYAADTRGYTYGAVFEYDDHAFTARFGEMLMPKVANGIDLDVDVTRAHAENVELEVHRHLLPGRLTIVRPLVFVNHANMGSYREAISGFLSGRDPVPDVTAYRAQGRIKYGAGLNLEQELPADLRGFLRVGWNDGHTESFAYTEIDRTISVGFDLRGQRWHRRDDKLGVAVVSSGLSNDHREYLQLGGSGFILGDGNLTYGLETTTEAYYTIRLSRAVHASVDLQRVTNPGFNRVRGPVVVGAFRLHVDVPMLAR
jgi:hypothetical protein